MNAPAKKEETISVVALKGYFPADGSEKMAKYGSKTNEYKVNDEWKIEKIPEPRDLPKSEALPMIKAKVLIRAEDL